MKKLKPIPQLVTELLQFFEQEGCKTTSSIARIVGVNQSQVYRNLYGSPKRLTKTHVILCKYAKIDFEIEAKDPRSCPVLMNALASVWDGSELHANQLADLLFAHYRASMRLWQNARDLEVKGR